MNTHTMKLAAEPFAALKSGDKVIESRLFDEKRQQVAPGDRIIFINREALDQSIETEVLEILWYPTFAAMFHDNDPAKFGGGSVGWLLDQINEFYSVEDQQRNGVVGFRISVLTP